MTAVERQRIQSVRSLRLYNRAIPVWLFLFHGATAELLHEAEMDHRADRVVAHLRHLPRLSFGTLSRDLVPQGGEFEDVLLSRRRCVVAHYYSGTEDELFSALSPLAS